MPRHVRIKTGWKCGAHKQAKHLMTWNILLVWKTVYNIITAEVKNIKFILGFECKPPLLSRLTKRLVSWRHCTVHDGGPHIFISSIHFLHIHRLVTNHFFISLKADSRMIWRLFSDFAKVGFSFKCDRTSWTGFDVCVCLLGVMTVSHSHFGSSLASWDPSLAVCPRIF